MVESGTMYYVEAVVDLGIRLWLARVGLWLSVLLVSTFPPSPPSLFPTS